MCDIQRFSWFSGAESWMESRNRRELTLQNVRDLERLATYAAAVSAESSLRQKRRREVHTYQLERSSTNL